MHMYQRQASESQFMGRERAKESSIGGLDGK
jgi:hypothetical protein